MVRKYAINLRWAKWALRREQRRRDRLHLLQVDISRQKSGLPCWSLRLEVNDNNYGHEVPWVFVVLFGESEHYKEIDGKMCLPPDGYRLVVD